MNQAFLGWDAYKACKTHHFHPFRRTTFTSGAGSRVSDCVSRKPSSATWLQALANADGDDWETVELRNRAGLQETWVSWLARLLWRLVAWLRAWRLVRCRDRWRLCLLLASWRTGRQLCSASEGVCRAWQHNPSELQACGFF